METQKEANLGGVSATLTYKLRPRLNSDASNFALVSHDTPYGLRYDGTFGQIKVGASVLRLDDESGTATELAMNYTTDNLKFSAGYERVSGLIGTTSAVMLGVDATFDRVTTGLSLVRNDYGTVADHYVTGYLTYAVLDNWDVTLAAQTFDSFHSQYDDYAINTEYRFAKGAYLQAGINDRNDPLLDTIYEMSAGWRF